MDRFKALIVTKGDAGQQIAWGDMGTADLMPGDVTVRISHSTINYKDGLAVTGKSPVVRRFPMVPGIDFAGTVLASESPAPISHPSRTAADTSPRYAA